MHHTISDFNFELPQDLIASEPLENRSDSRLMLVDRASKSLEDRKFPDVVSYLRPDDLLVINNTRVIPARLFGSLTTGAAVEVFLVRPAGTRTWEVLAKPGKRLKEGTRIEFESISARVLCKDDAGRVQIRFDGDDDLDAVIDRIGRTPVPPYIKRDKNEPDTDRERYQTVYASHRGAIAAPTAGLHFTSEVLTAIREQGTSIAEITLHVGYGTFEPVRAVDITQHRVEPESFDISSESAAALNKALAQGRRIVAVGTTTTRALESNFREAEGFTAGPGTADITILPGYRFRAVDVLLTNFHLPQSSLLILVSTFAGHDLIMKAYQHAIRNRYRFYSYGDCMMIV